MEAYVAVTDNDWYRFLRAQGGLDEVNFWQPSGHRQFKRIDIGEPFLFKLHHPENFVVGGGFFAHFSILPVSMAWEAFGEKNGVLTLQEMRRRIEKYRKIPPARVEDYHIGCILLQQPFFFDRADWIPAPVSFTKNIVQGRGYDLTSGEGRTLWEAVQQRLDVMLRPQGTAEKGNVYGDPVLVRQRLGQGTFRVLVTDVYERHCAVTGEKVLPVLEAAHILPVSEGGTHRVDNGLLLRSDLHTLFDRGYVTGSPDYRVHVSRHLKTDFENGEHYYQFEGTELWMPRLEVDRPKREFLEWHADSVYRG